MTSIIMKKTLLSLVLASCLPNQVSSNDNLMGYAFCNYDLNHFRSLQKAFPEKDKLFVGISKDRKIINYSVVNGDDYIPIINQRQLDDMKIPQDYQFFFKVSYNPKLNPYQREEAEFFFVYESDKYKSSRMLKTKNKL